MTTGETIEPLIEQATDWLLRLEEAPGDEAMRAAAEGWRTTDPAHARAWAQAERAYRMLADSPSRASAGGAAGSRIDAAVARRPAARRWAAGAVAALAACLMLLYVPGLLVQLRADVVTQTAELRRLTLEDGTTVQLAARTAVNVRFTRERRSVELLSGEAFFTVAPQASRPFDVRAGDLVVTVLGTAFDVRLSDEASTVGVQHGVVEAHTARAGAPSAIRLGPGDQLTVGRRDGTVQRSRVPPEEIAAWRDYRLFVEGATVAQVVDELRRYRSGWIVVADRELARQRVTGLYDLRDPDRALRALIGPFDGQVREITPLLAVISGP